MLFKQNHYPTFITQSTLWMQLVILAALKPEFELFDYQIYR